MKYINKLTDLFIKLSLPNVKSSGLRRLNRNKFSDSNLLYQLCIGMELCGYVLLHYQRMY